MNHTRLVVVALALLVGCTGSRVDTAPNSGDLATAAEWLTGSFDNTRQARLDSTYVDIRLEMVRIWSSRAD